jgi:DNA invertase Pin-like site-specific DNA recombinase
MTLRHQNRERTIAGLMKVRRQGKKGGRLRLLADKVATGEVMPALTVDAH